jgi:thiosulfate/3-mercaptopyruvate sulfurtransferase
MGLAIGIALVDPKSKSVKVNTASPTWSAAVEQGADHITSAELVARWTQDASSILAIDVRPSAEFAAFHLPGAVNLDLPRLLGDEGAALLDSASQRLVVLCSNGMTHPAQAWVELARRGRTNVRVLEDGLDGFVREVLTPPSLRLGASDANSAAALAAFQSARALFLPHQVPAPTQPATKPPATFARLATDPAQLESPTIVSATWVAQHTADIVLIDTRDKAEDFAAGHLPGALHVPTKHLRGQRGDVADELLPRAELAAKIGALGIDADTAVVAYGGERLQDPTHFALVMIHLGHAKVAVMEGGVKGWQAEGRALVVDTRTAVAKTYTASAHSGVAFAELADVQAASAGGAPLIVDVRPADAFCGDVSTEARAGHIPRSLNRPYTADIATLDAGIFWRSPADLEREFAALGLSKDQPVIVTCRTGHQASQSWFLMRYVLGYRDVRWYDGSWKEWALRSELPVETGSR